MRRLKIKLYALRACMLTAKIGIVVFVAGYFLLIAALETDTSMTIRTFFALLALLLLDLVASLLILTLATYANEKTLKRISRKKRYMGITELYNADRATLLDLFNRKPHEFKKTKETGRVLYRTDLVHGSIQDAILHFVKRNGIPYVVDSNDVVWYTEDGDKWACIQPRMSGGALTLLERS